MLLGACVAEHPVEWEVDPVVPTAVHLHWTTRHKGMASVEYGPVDGRWVAETPLAPVGTSHEVTVVGLTAGETHVLRPRVTASSGDVSVGEPVEIEIARAPMPSLDTHEGGPVEGYVLTNTIADGDTDVVAIVDREGAVVWYSATASTQRVLSTRLDEDGGSVWYTTQARDPTVTLATVHHLSMDGSIEEEWELDRLRSAVVPLPEGGYGYIRKHDGPWMDGRLLWDEIWEMEPDGSPRRVFSVLDHFEPGITCDHQTRELPDGDTVYDWTHANSLLLSPDRSTYFLMLRHLDAILEVDRATGELLWVLGGPYSDFEFEDDADRFDHAHVSQQVPGGFVVFDNGNHRDPRHSRVVRYEIDEAARTARAVWTHEGADGRFNAVLGDAKRLESGRYLISWSEHGLIEEVTGDGEVVWAATTPEGTAIGRVTPVPTLYPGELD